MGHAKLAMSRCKVATEPSLLFRPDLHVLLGTAEHGGHVVDEGGVDDALLGGAAEEEHGGARLTADAEGHEDVGRGEDLRGRGFRPFLTEEHGAQLEAAEGRLVDEVRGGESLLHSTE